MYYQPCCKKFSPLELFQIFLKGMTNQKHVNCFPDGLLQNSQERMHALESFKCVFESQLGHLLAV